MELFREFGVFFHQMLFAIVLFLFGIQTPPAGAISGRVFDTERKPLPGVTVQLVRRMYQNGRPILLTVQQATTDQNGEYGLPVVSQGRYYVSASYSKGFGITSTTYNVPDEGYPPIYYPGTAEPEAAAPLDLPAGGSLNAIDLTLYRVETLKIRGRVLGPDGAPDPDAWLSMLPGRSAVFLPLSMRRQSIRKDGSFEFKGLMPGSYELVADSHSADGEAIKARVFVQLVRNLEDVAIVLSPGIELDGRIAVENQTTDSVSNLLKLLTVSLRPSSDSQIVFSATGAVQADGSFRIRKVGPGDYTLQIGGLPPDYYVKSAYAGRTDVVELGLSVFAQPPGSMDIVISPRGGRVEGTIVDNDGAPVPGVQVVLIPEQRLRGREDLYKIAPAPNGAFSMGGVRPGNYKLFAWPATLTPAYMDPDFIRDYENRAESVRVDPESRIVVQARVLPALQR